MWRANITGSVGRRVPRRLRRGLGSREAVRSRRCGARSCTSADAGGLPDHGDAGDLRRGRRRPRRPRPALRPPRRPHPRRHLRSARRPTRPRSTSGGPDTPPYGVRLRLKAGVSTPAALSAGAQVIAQALKTYGMFLADGGQHRAHGRLRSVHDREVERPRRHRRSDLLASLLVDRLRGRRLRHRVRLRKPDTDCIRNPSSTSPK